MRPNKVVIKCLLFDDPIMYFTGVNGTTFFKSGEQYLILSTNSDNINYDLFDALREITVRDNSSKTLMFSPSLSEYLVRYVQ